MKTALYLQFNIKTEIHYITNLTDNKIYNIKGKNFLFIL